MKCSQLTICSRAMLGLAATFLASCAMPPAEAWRVIRNDGLIPYIAMEMGNKPVPAAPANRYLDATPAQQVAQAPAPAPKPAAPVAAAPAKADSKTTVEHKVNPPKPAPRLLLNNKPVVAEAPAKPKAEAPKPATPAPAKTVAEAPKPAPAPAPKKEFKVEKTVPAPQAPKTAQATPPTAPKKVEPAPAKPSTPAPASKTETAKANEELPYGTPVPGRPGLVNSPYAGKMQLVDITGLKPGQEVKCPYSGKLFRVPPGAQASTKTDEKKK